MNKQNISEKKITKTKCDSVNHTHFLKEDRLPDVAHWDNKVTKGDHVEVVWKFLALACRIPNSSPMWNSFSSFKIKTK